MKQKARRAGKLRGGRRYFARRRREADQFVAAVSSGAPLDLWHHHFDLRGHGERSPRLRRLHRRLLLEALDRIRAQISASRRPAQVFVQLAAPHHCGQDALYYHSRVDSPAGFPYTYPGVCWDTPWPGHIREVVADARLRVGHLRFEGADFWVLVDRSDPGLPV